MAFDSGHKGRSTFDKFVDIVSKVDQAVLFLLKEVTHVIEIEYRINHYKFRLIEFIILLVITSSFLYCVCFSFLF